mgnify:FL=1|tara:strand:- start:410 stop:1225 length:816 start_codon:yes stop_codon:yes gene_type:complete
MQGNLVSVGRVPKISDGKYGVNPGISKFDSDSDSDDLKTLSADTRCYAGTHNGKMTHLRKLTRPAFEALCSDIFWSRVSGLPFQGFKRCYEGYLGYLSRQSPTSVASSLSGSKIFPSKFNLRGGAFSKTPQGAIRVILGYLNVGQVFNVYATNKVDVNHCKINIRAEITFEQWYKTSDYQDLIILRREESLVEPDKLDLFKEKLDQLVEDNRFCKVSDLGGHCIDYKESEVEEVKGGFKSDLDYYNRSFSKRTKVSLGPSRVLFPPLPSIS